MKRSLGSFAAAAAMALSVGALGMGGMTLERNIAVVPDERPIAVKRRRDAADANRARGSGDLRHPRPTRMQPHSGAGGAGAHRRWKKRRAAGIY